MKRPKKDYLTLYSESGKTEEEINEIAKKCLIKYSKIFDVLYIGIINTLKQAPLNNYVKEIMPLKGDNNE